MGETRGLLFGNGVSGVCHVQYVMELWKPVAFIR